MNPRERAGENLYARWAEHARAVVIRARLVGEVSMPSVWEKMSDIERAAWQALALDLAALGVG